MNQLKISVRGAQGDDALALTMLSRRCFKKSSEWFVPKFVVCRWWRGVLGNGGGVISVAVDDGCVVGYTLSFNRYADWERVSTRGAHAKWIRILVLLTRPAFLKAYLARRRGIRLGDVRAESTGEGGGTGNDVQQLKRVSVKEELGGNGVYWAIVAVDPGSQGRGVGKVLLESVLEFGENSGANRVCLHVDARNKHAQGLYTKYGYDLTGRDGNNYLMTKLL